MPRKRRFSTKSGTASGSSIANEGPRHAHTSSPERKPDAKVLEELLRRMARRGDYSPSPSADGDDSASSDDSNDGGGGGREAGEASPPPLGGRIAFLESRMVEIDRCMRSILPHLSAVKATLRRIAEIPTEARHKRNGLRRHRKVEDDHFRGLDRSQSLQEMVSSPTALQETSGVRGCGSSYSFATSQDVEFSTQAGTSGYNTASMRTARENVTQRQSHLRGGCTSQHTMSVCYPQSDGSAGRIQHEPQMQQQACQNVYPQSSASGYGQHSGTSMLGFPSRDLMSMSSVVPSGPSVAFYYPNLTSGNSTTYAQQAPVQHDASQHYFHGNTPSKTSSQLHCSYMPIGNTGMMPAVFNSSERVLEREMTCAGGGGGSAGMGGSRGVSMQQLGAFPMATGFYAMGPPPASGSSSAISWAPGMTLVPAPPQATPHARKYATAHSASSFKTPSHATMMGGGGIGAIAGLFQPLPAAHPAVAAAAPAEFRNGRGACLCASDAEPQPSRGDAHEGGGLLPERGGGGGGRRDGQASRGGHGALPGARYVRSRSVHRRPSDAAGLVEVDPRNTMAPAPFERSIRVASAVVEVGTSMAAPAPTAAARAPSQPSHKRRRRERYRSRERAVEDRAVDEDDQHEDDQHEEEADEEEATAAAAAGAAAAAAAGRAAAVGVASSTALRTAEEEGTEAPRAGELMPLPPPPNTSECSTQVTAALPPAPCLPAALDEDALPPSATEAVNASRPGVKRSWLTGPGAMADEDALDGPQLRLAARRGYRQRSTHSHSRSRTSQAPAPQQQPPPPPT